MRVDVIRSGTTAPALSGANHRRLKRPVKRGLMLCVLAAFLPCFPSARLVFRVKHTERSL
jgi:hypothetical protein